MTLAEICDGACTSNSLISVGLYIYGEPISCTYWSDSSCRWICLVSSRCDERRIFHIIFLLLFFFYFFLKLIHHFRPPGLRILEIVHSWHEKFALVQKILISTYWDSSRTFQFKFSLIANRRKWSEMVTCIKKTQHKILENIVGPKYRECIAQ